jgi:hypothetical protein
MMDTEDDDDNATQSPEDYCAKIIKKYGVTSCVVETDDVRLTMTKTKQEELLAEMRSEIDETIQEILKDEDCQDIKEIQRDDDVTPSPSRRTAATAPPPNPGSPCWVCA